MSGVGKTTGARAVARRYDVRLYSLDAYNYVHAARADPSRHPTLVSFSTLALDDLWVRPEPSAIAERFIASSRERFELVLADVLALPTDAPMIVEGLQLLPEIVAPRTYATRQTALRVARRELQRRLVRQRGDGLGNRTSDPERARANRLRRDELLAAHVYEQATRHGFAVVEVEHPEERGRY